VSCFGLHAGHFVLESISPESLIWLPHAGQHEMTHTFLDSTTHLNKVPARGKQRFITVPVAILYSLPNLRCDLYIQHALSTEKILYRSQQIDLPIAADDHLLQGKVRHLFLRVEDEPLYEDAVRQTLAASPVDPGLLVSLSIEHRRTAFQSALIGNSIAPLVETSGQLAEELLPAIQQDDFCLNNVIRLLTHDHCTFQHSCNVAIYASALAKHVGIGNPELEQVATGGLLHDIGKRHIPSFILRKAGKLNQRERELVRDHAKTGFLELAALGKLNWNQLMMVYQHHEWFNGDGYPVGSNGEEIQLWARICAIADVFDALTANRPYRPMGYTDQALQIMNDEAGHFDPELLRLWNEVVQQ
jgi:putative nucleotidyltransferase with HDIG domain